MFRLGGVDRKNPTRLRRRRRRRRRREKEKTRDEGEINLVSVLDQSNLAHLHSAMMGAHAAGKCYWFQMEIATDSTAMNNQKPAKSPVLSIGRCWATLVGHLMAWPLKFTG